MDDRCGGTAKAFRRAGTVCLLLTVALLSACATDVQPLALQQARRCALPWRYNAALSAMSSRQRAALEPLTPLQPEFPSKAAFQMAEGCALVRFTVGPGGVPRHIVVVGEYPAGAGFGEALTDAVSKARFRGPDSRVHYQKTDFLMAGGGQKGR